MARSPSPHRLLLLSTVTVLTWSSPLKTSAFSPQSRSTSSRSSSSLTAAATNLSENNDINDNNLNNNSDNKNQIQPTGPIHTLILVRHGDSIWNGKYPGCQETFTGWTDVPLSPIGIDEAKRSGEVLVRYAPCGAAASANDAVGSVGTPDDNNSNNIIGRGIDALFTSNLSRAKMTAHYCWWAYYDQLEKRYSLQKKYQYYNTQYNIMQQQQQQQQNNYQHQTQQQTTDPTPRQFLIDHRLNERHYGSLQGLIKSQTEAGIHGHSPKDVQAWRRSWHAIPPLLDENDPRRLDELRKYVHLVGGNEEDVPRGESLEMVAENRIRPFLVERVTPLLEEAYLEEKTKCLLNYNNDNHQKDNQSIRKESHEEEEGGTALIVAHANSLRALIGVLCNVENDPISLKKLEDMKIPTATPMVIRYRKTNLRDYFWAVDSLSEKNDNIDNNHDNDDGNNVGGERLPVYPLSSIPLPIRKKVRQRMEEDVTDNNDDDDGDDSDIGDRNFDALAAKQEEFATGAKVVV